MSRLRDVAAPARSWLFATLRPARLGIRPVDVLATALVVAAVELNNATATGPSQHPLDAVAYTWGVVVALPVLLRHRWPRGVLIACSILLLAFYTLARRDIAPVPLLCLPLYDAAAAGFLVLAIIIPAVYMTIGLFLVDASTHQSVLVLTTDFLPSMVVLLLAILLGDAVRSRRAIAAQTAERLRLAAEEREHEAARRVTEERLRIARELHDTVAHSMATITVQAASALHVLGGGPAGSRRDGVRDALAAIRDTSKAVLADIRITLGELRGGGEEPESRETRTAGLARLDALTSAVRAAGAPVTVVIRGEQVPLPSAVDHSVYRILQECLTNVLRHAGPEASAEVVLRFDPGSFTIEVTDDGTTSNGAEPGGAASGGHGLTGMTERAQALGGELTAGPRPGGGFAVTARLPFPAASPVQVTPTSVEAP